MITATHSAAGENTMNWTLIIEQWTIRHSAAEVTQKLQACGVAAYPSLAPNAMMQDAHLLARNAFPTVYNDDTGERQRAVTPPWRFSETPARIDQWTPTLGQHNLDVFFRHPRTAGG